MFEVFYKLFIVCCVFGISLSGFIFALAMWRKSNTICNKCKKELDVQSR